MTAVAPRELDDQAEVVLFSNDDYYLDLALRLRHQGVRLNALVVKSTERFREHFPDIELIQVNRLREPEAILQLNAGDPECISSADLERFAHAEILYLHLTDRLTYYPTTVRSRVQLFRALLRFWLRFFADRKNVGTIFFVSAPHMGEDVVAYHVAKSVGVRTLFVERSLITNRVFLLEDYSAVDKVPATFLADDPLDAIEQRIEPALLQAIHQSSPWSRHSAAINQNVVANRSQAKTSRAPLWQLPGRVVAVASRWGRPAKATVFWHHGGTVPGYRFEVEKAVYRRRVKGLRELYESLVSAPGEAPYFLFMLHLQPERSTCPQGGVYDDQLLAIETAAKALPQGCELYVKEHPRQFSPTHLKGRHFRDDAFYRRLGAMPHVRLMAIGSETGKLIEGALATATTTGSAGWESLVAGKPCLAFGTPWYGGCRSCHLIRSIDDCRDAYAACTASSQAQVKRDLLAFLAYVQDRLIYSSNSALFARGAEDYEKLIDNLALAVAGKVRHRLAGPS